LSKYRAIKTDGYASKKEARRAGELKLLLFAGQISELIEQVPFELAPSVVVQGRKRPPIKYIADFVYLENGKRIVEDSKGMRTPVYNLKRHLMMSVHGIEIKET
jgi:hypothetical protein